uniref:Uncharacterized protein n=1 Tax=Lotharella globosa TaxID=91324 RepID=A0A7S4DUL6_9EUKA
MLCVYECSAGLRQKTKRRKRKDTLTPSSTASPHAGFVEYKGLIRTLTMFHRMYGDVATEGSDPSSFADVIFEKARKIVRPQKLNQRYCPSPSPQPCQVCTKECDRLCRALYVPICGSECCDANLRQAKKELQKRGRGGRMSFQTFAVTICTHPMVQTFFSLEDPSMYFGL